MRDQVEEILQDGNWHPLSQFLILAKDVQPEVAARIYLYSNNKRSRDSIVRNKTLEEQVTRGKRRIVENHLKHLRKLNVVEIRGTGFNKEYRRVSSNGNGSVSK